MSYHKPDHVPVLFTNNREAIPGYSNIITLLFFAGLAVWTAGEPPEPTDDNSKIKKIYCKNL